MNAFENFAIGLLEGAWFLITNGSKLSLPRGQSLEAGLPEALRQRFVATRSAIGRGEDRYKTDTPIRARKSASSPVPQFNSKTRSPLVNVWRSTSQTAPR